MLKLSEQEKQEIIRYLESDRPFREKYRFLVLSLLRWDAPVLTTGVRRCLQERPGIAWHLDVETRPSP